LSGLRANEIDLDTMAVSYYGPFVMSDITHYANEYDLKALLQQKFPPTVAQPKPWTYTVSSFDHVLKHRASWSVQQG
jgi:hypothetical protein